VDNRGRRVQTNTYTEEQIKRVLVGSGITVESEVGSDFIIFCPYHNNTRTPAGEVSKQSGLFFCFSCQQTADLQELIMKMTNRSYFESIRFIKSKEKETNIEDLINKKLYKPKEFIQYDEVLIKRLTNQTLESPRAMRYFEGRKITKRSIEKFSLGYSEKQDMVTIPVQSPDGMTIGFVARTIEGKEFKNTPGLPKSKILFNLHRIKTSSRVYVLESSFDAIRVDQVGFPAVATLGANVSSSQIELLKKYFSEICVVADNDDAGNTMANKLIEKIGSKAYMIKLDNKYKDIGDMLDSDIIELLQKSDNFVDQIFGTNK
jgi:DNA primase